MMRSRDVKGSKREVVTLVFKEQRGMAAISRRAKQVCDPGSDLYGRYLTRTALARKVSPPPGAIAQCRGWFESHGLRFHTTPNPQICWVDGSRRAVRRLFGGEADAWLRREPSIPPRHRWPVPERIAGLLKSISVSDFETHRMARAVKGLPPEGTRRDSLVVSASSPAEVSGMTPSDIRAIYDFPPEWTGKGETIFLLNLGARVGEADLQAFWQRHGIDRGAHLTEQIDIGHPMKSYGFVQQLEPTMGAQWIGALAPDARLCIYNIDAEDAADPWVAFLTAVVALDLDGKERREPTIAVSTWSLPERLYYAQHGREVFADLLEQAAALGVTMVAASGDWGVYDGRPSATVDGTVVAEAPWPHGVFPSVEDYVLSVGGTMITSRHPLTEVAWSGPLPPNKDLRQFLPFSRLASSGGFSEDVGIPWWQKEVLRPRGIARYFRRGLNAPAVLPSGRGYPDVALMAQGPSIADSTDVGLVSVGFDAVVSGQRINYAGGTSMAAPIWAAIIACMNEARRARRASRVGFVNPLLYRLAATPNKRVFRAITVGASDVELRVLDEAGRPTGFLLEGFSASRSWNPVTGLGVPNVRNLIAASTRATRRGPAHR